jgi:hypothetical protein
VSTKIPGPLAPLETPSPSPNPHHLVRVERDGFFAHIRGLPRAENPYIVTTDSMYLPPEGSEGQLATAWWRRL